MVPAHRAYDPTATDGMPEKLTSCGSLASLGHAITGGRAASAAMTRVVLHSLPERGQSQPTPNVVRNSSYRACCSRAGRTQTKPLVPGRRGASIFAEQPYRTAVFPSHWALPGGKNPFANSCASIASASCRRLLPHCVRRADSRAPCTAGSSRATSRARMAITTSNSTRLNPGRAVSGVVRVDRNEIPMPEL